MPHSRSLRATLAVCLTTLAIVAWAQRPPSTLKTPARNPARTATSTATWTATWAASPCASPPASPRFPALRMENQTLREIVHLSVGGSALRIRLSNAYGKAPLQIEAASAALRQGGNRIVAATAHPLTFSGRHNVIVPAGAYALSDPVTFTIPAHADLAVSLFTTQPVESVTVHHAALTTSYFAAGNQVAALELTGSSSLQSWPFLSAVEVDDTHAKGAIVALGSSITDGAASTPDKNHRWTDFLADRLQPDRAGKQYGLINEGIGGNRVLHDGAGPLAPVFGQSALARFDRDVLAQAGVRYVVVFEGGNDISQPGSPAAPTDETVTAADLIAGYTQLAERAHEHGIRIIFGTLTPFEGMTSNIYNPEREAMRSAVNLWMRTTTLADGLIDFDRSVLDPNHPSRILPGYDSGDHLHLNDAGYQRMAEKIDLSLFR